MNVKINKYLYLPHQAPSSTNKMFRIYIRHFPIFPPYSVNGNLLLNSKYFLFRIFIPYFVVDCNNHSIQHLQNLPYNYYPHSAKRKRSFILIFSVCFSDASVLKFEFFFYLFLFLIYIIRNHSLLDFLYYLKMFFGVISLSGIALLFNFCGLFLELSY